MNRQYLLLVPCLLLLAAAAPASAQAPSYEEILGRPQGERITQHHEMVGLLEAWAEASDRVEIFDQGASWEGRRFVAAIVTSPANHARLAAIRETARRLDDPRATSEAEARELIANQPAIVWMGGSIHGFELSGAEGVIRLLEHLATGDDEATISALDNTVVILDPMLNPDGRDAFAQVNHRRLGSEPSPDRDDWANDFTRWQALQYRTGHYYFDTNRDWWAHTQRETRARVPTLLAWRPQVVVDLHEMGSDVEFYFDPAADPYGPFFPDFARKWFARFGEAYAAAFDGAGFEYMTRERYNYFYPGYTTSYGSYQGAVGMLYEQGSTRGLALHRADESVRTLADAYRQQYTAAWTAVRTAAENREELLADYYQAHVAAVADGRQGTVRYLIAPGGDPALFAELAALLRRNGVEVVRLTEPVTLNAVSDRAGGAVGSRSFPTGTLVVEASQPRNRLVRALLEPDLPLGDEFLAAARERVDRGENPRFYDITAWSLPMLFDLPGFGSTDRRSLPVEPVGPTTPPVASFPEEAPRYAYLIDGRQTAAVAALYHLRHAGVRAAVMFAPTRIGDRDFASGTVVVRVGQNDDAATAILRGLAERYRLTVAGVDTGLSAEGFPALGSGDESFPVKTAEIALLAEQPVHGYSFGWTWYTLDRQYGIPVTARRVETIGSKPLDRFNVLVIPNLMSTKELAKRLGEKGVERLKSWVSDGGTLVAMAAGADFVRNELEISELRDWYEVESGVGKDDKEGEEAPGPQRFTVPGALLRIEADPRSWLFSGYGDDPPPVLATSNRLWLAPEGAPSSGKRVAASYADTGDLRLSGHAWPESLERLPGTVFAYEEKIGDGRVILFAEDLNWRGYWRGANRMFLNAVVLGPSAR